jgi:hypothetical protein
MNCSLPSLPSDSNFTAGGEKASLTPAVVSALLGSLPGTAGADGADPTTSGFKQIMSTAAGLAADHRTTSGDPMPASRILAALGKARWQKRAGDTSPGVDPTIAGAGVLGWTPPLTPTDPSPTGEATTEVETPSLLGESPGLGRIGGTTAGAPTSILRSLATFDRTLNPGSVATTPDQHENEAPPSLASALATVGPRLASTTTDADGAQDAPALRATGLPGFCAAAPAATDAAGSAIPTLNGGKMDKAGDEAQTAIRWDHAPSAATKTGSFDQGSPMQSAQFGHPLRAAIAGAGDENRLSATPGLSADSNLAVPIAGGANRPPVAPHLALGGNTAVATADEANRAPVAIPSSLPAETISQTIGNAIATSDASTTETETTVLRSDADRPVLVATDFQPPTEAKNGPHATEQEKSAVSRGIAGGGSSPAGIRVGKKILSSTLQAVRSTESNVGTGVAKSVTGMSSESLDDRASAPIAILPSLAVPDSTGLASQPATDAPAPGTPSAVAQQTVATVLTLLDAQEARGHSTARSVNLQFRFGQADLTVHVELRAGEVYAQFRTDSAELRTALAQEWQTVVSHGTGSAFRLAAPEFLPGTASMSGTTSHFSGENAPRQQSNAQTHERPLATESGNSGRTGAQARTVSVASSPAPNLNGAVHLNAFA